MEGETTPAVDGAKGPRRLGRYVLLGTVGRGGCGEVVRARAFGAGGATKDLCLKRIHGDRLARPGALERFVDEARLSLRLAHANIVAVFDFGRAGDEHYLAMEWVDGADLRSVLGDAEARGEALPVAVAAHVAAEVARALAYAHGLGVVHNDVKPANVLVARTGDVKLTDFGVATAVETARGGGTRGYLPPEQGAGAAATPASDLWALGVVLAEMLGIDEGAPGELAPILTSLLARDPAARAADASEVARALEAVVARARAADGVAPRDVLAARATRLAEVRREARAEGTYEASASWARDGETAFTAPTSPASHRASDAPRAARWAGPGVAVLGALVAMASAVGVTAVMDGGAAAPVVGRAAVAVAVAEAETVAVAETETVAVAEAETETVAASETVAVAVAESETAAEGVSGAAPAGARGRGRARAVAPEPAPAGATAHLRVNAIPWAEVELDGRPIGSTPLLDVAVAPGRHTLRFTHPALGIERVQQLEVAPGERRDLVVSLD